MRSVLQTYIRLFEAGGLGVLQGVIVPVGKKLEAFRGRRKGEPDVYLLFAIGPWSDQEISILAAEHKPGLAIEEALKSLRAIETDRLKRRRRESITRRPARFVFG